MFGGYRSSRSTRCSAAPPAPGELYFCQTGGCCSTERADASPFATSKYQAIRHGNGPPVRCYKRPVEKPACGWPLGQHAEGRFFPVRQSRGRGLCRWVCDRVGCAAQKGAHGSESARKRCSQPWVLWRRCDDADRWRGSRRAALGCGAGRPCPFLQRATRLGLGGGGRARRKPSRHRHLVECSGDQALAACVFRAVQDFARSLERDIRPRDSTRWPDATLGRRRSHGEDLGRRHGPGTVYDRWRWQHFRVPRRVSRRADPGGGSKIRDDSSVSRSQP